MLAFFCAAFDQDKTCKKIQPDVYKISYEDAIKYIENDKLEKIKLTTETIKQILDFIIIDITKLKTIYKLNQITQKREPERQILLPIWERENRPDRIEVKPIYKENGDLVFSPVILFVLVERWFGGLDSLYPLYEYGLDNITAEVKKEEHINQTQMVTDIADLFGKEFIVNKDLYLASRFPKDKYPKDEDLGDYDILAISKTSKIIWNIECKFFQRVGSISEFAKHQNTFFRAGKDAMFNKRIKYLKENYPKILKSLQIDDNAEYQIESHMVTNKLFIPYVKKVDFSCITYSELKEKLFTK